MFRLRTRNGPYQHVLARSANVNGGAEELAYEKALADPVLLARGPGQLAGQMRSVTPALIELHPASPPMGSPQLTATPNSYSVPESALIEPTQ